MNNDKVFEEIETLRAEIRALDERLTKVETKQDKIDKILDKIAVLESKIDRLLE